MKSFLILVGVLALGVLNLQATQPACIRAVHYRFSTPDPAGDPFWERRNHDDSSWRTAAELAEIGAAVEKEKPADVYLRIDVDHTPESLNNFYFRARCGGPLEIYVNGVKAGGAAHPSEDWQDYTITPRRPETLGPNVYALHCRAGGGAFALEARAEPWVTTDDGQWRPAPVLPDLMRDAEVCAGPDGTYYLTATTGDDEFLLPNPKVWLISPGIQVFRSRDLRHWTSLGYVWTIERDATWAKEFGTFSDRGPARGIFAPEIRYHDEKFWLNYSVNNATPHRFFGIGMLVADRPEGPYRETTPGKPLTEGFDSNVFIDDDGAPFLLKQGGEIAALTPDYAGVAGAFRSLRPSNYPSVGYEGVDLFKFRGKYYLTSAEWNVHADGKVSYDSMVASSDHREGPYGERYCALRFGGHNGYFEGPDGQLYATVWCYPDGDPHWQRVSIVRMDLGEDGRFHLVKTP